VTRSAEALFEFFDCFFMVYFLSLLLMVSLSSPKAEIPFISRHGGRKFSGVRDRIAGNMKIWVTGVRLS